MTKDEYKNITNMTWTAKGKIAKVQKTDGSFAEYRYDGMNNRIFARVYTPASTSAGVSTPESVRLTHYVRDASGNVLGIYEEKELSEYSIYGSNRAGTSGKTAKFAQTLGTKKYEFSNHLGNVNVVISDNKYKNASFYAAFVLSQRDYYVYGQVMRGRTHEDARYRYAYNGKELEEDLGKGLTDFGGRILHTWGGFWLSVDPLASKYPMFSPYVSMGGNPMMIFDSDGRKLKPVNEEAYKAILKMLRPEDAKNLYVDSETGNIELISTEHHSNSLVYKHLQSIVGNDVTVIVEVTDKWVYKNNNGEIVDKERKYMTSFEEMVINNKFKNKRTQDITQDEFLKAKEILKNGQYKQYFEVLGNVLSHAQDNIPAFFDAYIFGISCPPLRLDENQGSHFAWSVDNNVYVYASTLNEPNELSATIAHELGHVYLYLQGYGANWTNHNSKADPMMAEEEGRENYEKNR